MSRASDPIVDQRGHGSLRDLRALSRHDVSIGGGAHSADSLASLPSLPSAIVAINCGGTMHAVAEAALLRFPNTLLAKAVSGKVEVSRDKQGNLFFDRHPGIFPDILNFYRTNGAVLQPNPHTTQRAFDEELHFFQITNGPNQKVVTVNCGGRIHSVAIATLARFPATLLGQLATGEISFQGLPRDAAGNLFLDRDPDAFTAILNFYRSEGRVAERGPTTSPRMWEEELGYFKLPAPAGSGSSSDSGGSRGSGVRASKGSACLNPDDMKFIRRMTATRRPSEVPPPPLAVPRASLGLTASGTRGRRVSSYIMPPPPTDAPRKRSMSTHNVPPSPGAPTLAQKAQAHARGQSVVPVSARRIFEEKEKSWWKNEELSHGDIYDFLGFDSGLIVWKHSKANAGYGPRRLFVDVDINALCWTRAKDKQGSSKVSRIFMRDIKTVQAGLCTEVLGMTAAYENSRTRLDEDALANDPTAADSKKGYFGIISVDREVSFEARSIEHMEKIIHFIRRARELKCGPLLWSPPSVAHPHAADMSRQRSFRWIADYDSQYAEEMGVSQEILENLK